MDTQAHSQRCASRKYTHTHETCAKVAQPHKRANMLRNIQARKCSTTPQLHTLRSSLIHRQHAQVTLQHSKTHIQIHSYAHRDTLKCTLQSTHPGPTLGNIHTQRYNQACSPTHRHTHSEICVYTDAQKVYTAVHTGAQSQKHTNTEQCTL